MSDFGIPKDIDITLEQAVNLLLKSVAMEEMSLSRLIEAEKNKILHILNRPDLNPRDLVDINNSVDSTLKNITKIQMLLQQKIDSAARILPLACPENCTVPVMSCPESGKTRGNAEGVITDGFNEFYACPAAIDFCAEVSCLCKSCVKYNTGNDDVSFSFSGCAAELNLAENEITLKGGGRAVKTNGKSVLEGNAKFVLMIKHCRNKILTFDIIMMSKNPVLQNRSGIVTALSSDIKTD